LIGWCLRRRSAALLCAHHGGNRWELLSCARRRHVTYAPEDAALADRLSGNTGVSEVRRSGLSYSTTDNRFVGDAVSVRDVALWITHDH
jgi:hypothetical protein